MSDSGDDKKEPIKVDLQDKSYVWCACEKSKRQPFCDGSHKGTGIKPLYFHPEKVGPAYLCVCKRTKNPPYCDGSHSD